jgi:alpha-ketoglutarate-dependent taurine dioxygenase
MPEQLTGRIVVVDADPGTDPATWIPKHRAQIRESVARQGAVLVRGLPIRDRPTAVAAVRAAIGEEVREHEGFAPREAYGGGAYSSMRWPSDQPMCMHHELSYLLRPPRLMAFACVRPARTGGGITLADAGTVLADLPEDILTRFERHGWLLARHYNPFAGLTWQDAFGTEDRDEVQRYCDDNDVDTIWQADNLSTRQTRAAVVTDPESGERYWFNQIAFLNEWTMEPDVRQFLIEEFGPESLPFTTFSGDGSALDRATVDQINAVYERHTIREAWQQGDLLLLDNLRIAHSREPYQGDREIVVGLGEPFRQSKLSVR